MSPRCDALILPVVIYLRFWLRPPKFIVEIVREYGECVCHGGPSVSGAVTLLMGLVIKRILAATRADWSNPAGAEGHWLCFSLFRSQGRCCTPGLLTAGASEGDVSIGQPLPFPWELASPCFLGGHLRLCFLGFLCLLCYLPSEWLFPGSLRVIISHSLLYFKLCHGSTSPFRAQGWRLSGIYLHFPLSALLPRPAAGLACRPVATLPLAWPWALGGELEAPRVFFPPRNLSWILCVVFKEIPVQ